MLEPNPDRHYAREGLLRIRKKLYVLFALWKRSGRPRAGKLLEQLKSLRNQERKWSKVLRSTPPLVDSTGKGVWKGKHFKRFRHSSKAKKFFKNEGKWCLK